ncbi:hypothetical protein BX666DRAFT_1994349 [Dichotomocladium elegans]|nr:hypothetical protein BX666DRAFT_1994349 [Dichotomocladium elegans]
MTIAISPSTWPQLSFILAQRAIADRLHIRFLTPGEASQFETAVKTYTRWLAFITTPATLPDGRLSKRAVASLRVRALLTEQLIPHLYYSDRSCCQHVKIDLDRVNEEAHLVQLIEIPSLCKDVKNGTDETQGIQIANAEAIPLLDEFHTLEKDYVAMTEFREKETMEVEMTEEEKRQQEDDHPFAIFDAESSMDLKYLIQGIMKNRQKITLSDRDIYNLLSEFKPQHKTKWASDGKLGQEELYESCEKVLIELKNFTDHSGPFLNKVSRREAPDYYDVIKTPMDLGTVTKKMKTFQYRSKKEFSDDLYLMYMNCLQYNTDPSSEYRKHAIAMRRKTERLLLKVPDIVIRSKSGNDLENFGEDISDGEDVHATRKSIPTASSEQPKELGHRERSLTLESSETPIDGEYVFTACDIKDAVMMPSSDFSTHKTYGGKKPKDNRNGDAKDQEENLEMDALQDQLWHDMTKVTRAKLGMDLDQQYEVPFSDRPAILRSPFDMGRFNLIERSHHNPELIQKLIKISNDRFQSWIEIHGPYIQLSEALSFDLNEDIPVDVFAKKAPMNFEGGKTDSLCAGLFLPEYVHTCGIPEITDGNEDIFDKEIARELPKAIQGSSQEQLEEAYSDIPLDLHPSARFPAYGLDRIIDGNLRQLEKIRTMYAKCSAIKNNTPVSSIPFIDTQAKSKMPSSTAAISEVDAPALILSAESGFQLMERIVSKLLAHAGFEGAQRSALGILTELAVDYMLNLGKTLRYYWDDYGHRQMTDEEILIHALYENGTKSIDELESYIHNDIERYGVRLQDIYCKLETSYQDLLSGSYDRSEEDDEGLFQYEETFITGAFGDGFGDDYFGFSAIGLDKEYNIDTLSIPPRLWSGANKEKSFETKVSEHGPALTYPPPPRFTSVTADTQVIGLLRPFFKQKLTEKLMEDEDIPSRHRNRPKCPPTNKSLHSRKRLNEPASPGRSTDGRSNGSNCGGSVGNGSGSGSGNSKVKRKRPIEEIQAMKEEREKRKMQKLEEKAQRMAEKEQRRKLREELKEKEKVLKQGTKGKKMQVKKIAVTS